MVRTFPVNWLMFGCLLLVGCRAGRTTTAGSVYTLGQVVSSTAEAGLEEAIKSGVAAALTERAAFAESGAPVIDVAVLAAAVQATSASPAGQTFAARLQISVRTEGRSAQFSSERSYTVIDDIQGQAARAAAFDGLSSALALDAVEWLLAGDRGDDE